MESLMAICGEKDDGGEGVHMSCVCVMRTILN